MKELSRTAVVRTRQLGFTLIELIVTVGIVAVVATIAAPNLQTFILNSRLNSTSTELLRSMQTARTEATKRQQNVVICTSADPTATPSATAPSCSTSGITGWIVFQDSDSDWSRAGATEELIEAHTFEAEKIRVLTDNSMRVSFSATGFATPNGGTAASQTRSTSMVVCDSRGNAGSGSQSTARGFFISNTGRMRATRYTTDITTLLSNTGLACS